MRKFLACLIFCCFFPTTIFAAEFGLAASIGFPFMESQLFGIAMPIRFDNFFIEPELAFYDRDSSTTTLTSSSDSSSTYVSLGTGVYLNKKINSDTETYYGARLGIIDTASKNSSSSGSSGKDDGNGYYFAPTIGFQYFFGEKFSFGLDASMYYTDIDETEKDYSGGVLTNRYEYSDKSTIFISRFMVRGYF